MAGYVQPGPQRATHVHTLFDRIAPRYDLINDLQSFGLHRHWKSRLVALAGLKEGDRVLDLCCGTGDVTRQFARCGARVVGIDFNAAMLGVAKDTAATNASILAFVR